MTADRWDRVKQIVGDALELGRDARPGFVENQCGEDADLRGEVETLLRADDPDSTFLELDRAPARIGPYRVEREIGRGGMGTVYLAERDDGQFQQRVAIKVIKRGMDTDAVLRRFYAERQILARLQHPNITRLFDGGMFESRPYFVMEYLEGQPILEYCRKLSLNERIRLFLDVCGAVEHAHRNLILHRDIKAGNILVDSTGTPKLLDFGIAKLLEADGAVEQTVVAQRVLTPQTASPEQLRGEPLTTASDVYALGVLLFELLSGVPPYRLAAVTPDEWANAVTSQPVPKPSESAAPDRGLPPSSLRGDLDNITLKALEQDPARRYSDAALLAADLTRYLEGRPVQARPTGTVYRVQKFIGRNRRSLAIAVIVFLAITAAVGDAILQGRRAARRFQDVRQMANSFLFEFHDAIANLPGSTPARELVITRALQYLSKLESESAGDLDLKRELAQSYMRIGIVQGTPYDNNLGKPQAARASFERAVALFEEVHRARPADMGALADLGEAENHLSSVIQSTMGPSEGMQHNLVTAHLLENAARRHNPSPRVEFQLALAFFGVSESQMIMNRSQEALQTRLRSIELLRDVISRAPDLSDAQRYMGQSEKRLAFLYLTQLHQPAKAVESLRIALDIDRKRVAREPGNAVAKLDLALGQVYLAAAMRRAGDLPAALGLLNQGIAARGAVLSADPRNFRVRYLLITDYTKLGAWLYEAHRNAEASEAFQTGFRLVAEMDANAARLPDAMAAAADLKKQAVASGLE